MQEPTYREALGHAWKLTWHHKSMWVLGLLSIFLGQFGLSNFLGQLISKIFFEDNSWWPASWGAIHIVSPDQFLWFGWISFIVAALILFIVAASVCAEGALIATAVHYFNVHTVLSIHNAWRQGVKHFWRILGINVLEKLLLSIILWAIIELMAVVGGISIMGFFLQVLVIAAGVFLALAISTVAIFTLGYCIVDNQGLIDALAEGWHLFRRHVLVSLELSIMLLLCNALVFAALWFGSFLVLIPSFFLSVAAGFTGYLTILAISVAAYVFLFVLVIAFLGAIFNAFTTSAWMYLFMHMYHEGLASRVAHWAGKILKR
ncbi:MAG: hypothetical protein EXS55_00835 [Candidatus Magasanikbacteria bacterium]|nr:hypothetical protein [Candidatus Magasanikbacteria bacterium]